MSSRLSGGVDVWLERRSLAGGATLLFVTGGAAVSVSGALESIDGSVSAPGYLRWTFR